MMQTPSDFDIEAALRHPRFFLPSRGTLLPSASSREARLAILREWELDARRLSASESEGSVVAKGACWDESIKRLLSSRNSPAPGQS